MDNQHIKKSLSLPRPKGKDLFRLLDVHERLVLHDNVFNVRDIINTTDLDKAKKEIKKSKKPVIIKAQDDNFNRKILEHGKFEIILSPESGNRKDKVKQLDSGLNHVLAKIAKKNNISIGISTNEIKFKSSIEKAKTLSRIIQNIKLCRKAKTNLKYLGNQKEGFHFLISLGANNSQAKEATSKNIYENL